MMLWTCLSKTLLRIPSREIGRQSLGLLAGEFFGISDGCPCTVWISNILSRPVADLVHLGDHISSCSSNPSVQISQLFSQSLLASTCTFVPQLLGPNHCSSTSVMLCLLMYKIPSDSVYYTFAVASFNLLFCCSSCLGWVLAVVSERVSLTSCMISVYWQQSQKESH